MFTRKRQPNPDSIIIRTLGTTLGTVILFVLEIVQIVIISAAIIIPIRYFLIQPFYVKGASMEPNFFDHEYLIIDEISYRFNEPERGDIVVFRYPRDPSQFFIKRVVALPSETVEISDGRVIIYNDEFPEGVILLEDYLDPSVVTLGKKRSQLNVDEYFVLGDNRDASLDSRSFGPVRIREIVGKVWVRGLPISRVGIFESPAYNIE